MFFLGLRKPFPWGAVGWWWAWKLSRIGFGTTFFWVIYSFELHFSHPCAMRTISCLALDKVDWIMSFTTDFFVTTSWWRCGWKYFRSSRWPRTPLSLLTLDSLFRSSSRSWHELQQWDMVIVLLKPSQNKKGRKIFQLHQNWCLFLQLAAKKKTPFLAQLEFFLELLILWWL